MKRTLKEQFIKNLKQGSMVDVTFVTYEKETFIRRYCYINDTLYSLATDIDGIGTFIEYDDIGLDLEIFKPEFKYASITNIIEPIEYKCIFNNPTIVDLTQKEIEKILGYKINIVEE